MADGVFARERPLLAVVVLVIVATVAYVGVTLALGSRPTLVGTAIFAAVFTVVYMAFATLRDLLG
ncbi:MAG: hypothetical protein ABEI96_01480 [Haloarculaceae archaeon]